MGCLGDTSITPLESTDCVENVVLKGELFRSGDPHRLEGHHVILFTVVSRIAAIGGISVCI